MKHSPIIFSAPMVRAILEGRKTQTRRLIKGFALEMCRPDMFTPKFVAMPENEMSPYGYADDTLWVRETFAEIGSIGKPIDWFEYQYKADFRNGKWEGDGSMCFDKWKPSIHMPRAASRITLKINHLRVERLKGISEADAIAEGVEQWPDGNYKAYGKYAGKYTYARDSFHSLWETIHGPESWKENPFVWVIGFEKT